MRQSIGCVLFVILMVMQVQAKGIGFDCYDASTKTVDLSCNGRRAELNNFNVLPQKMKTDVERLWINNCKIVDLIQFINSFENLHELNITSSELDASDLKKLKNLSELTKLSLTHDNIVKIPIDFTQKMSNVIELDLSHNNIFSIDTVDFQDATALKTIHLSYNHISHINIFPSYLPTLRDIYLIGNRLRSVIYPKLYKLNLNIRDKIYLCNYMWPQSGYKSINLHFGTDDIELHPDNESKCLRSFDQFSIDDFPMRNSVNKNQHHNDGHFDEKSINSKHSPFKYTPHTGFKTKILTHDLRIVKTERSVEDVQSEEKILEYNDFRTVGIVVIVISVTLLFALIGFFIRYSRNQKDKLKKLQIRRQAIR